MYKYEQQVFMQYLNSTKSELREVYNNPSEQKRKIYDDIRSGMREVGGKRFRILSHNGWYFSCAYLYRRQDKVYLAVFRPTRNFDVDVTETVLGVQV